MNVCVIRVLVQYLKDVKLKWSILSVHIEKGLILKEIWNEAEWREIVCIQVRKVEQGKELYRNGRTTVSGSQRHMMKEYSIKV